MSNTDENKVLQTAQTAFRYFQTGWKTGNFDDYLAMITDDFEFSFPHGKLRGIFTGKTGREKMFQKCRDDSASGARLILDEPRTTAIDENTVIFEFESTGDFGDYKYHGRNIIVLTIENDKVNGFREYFGDIDPQLFAAANNSEQ